MTPRRAIHDGIEAHIRHGLIEQAIETARRRGAITRADVAELKQALSEEDRLPVGASFTRRRGWAAS